ncbi:cation:proton antiporter [Alteromonas gracilis]|uniref:cation:proton antiporter n=1 Tax=Alteromonas gracilis TaxID=1479524 RepID=UPI003735D467
MHELIAQSSFFEITLLLCLASAIGIVGLLFRQPLIVAFIAIGIVSGPTALDLVHSQEKINLLSELGIALLLFLVGIKLDLKLIKDIGVVSLATGLGQVFFTSVIGYAIGLMLGFDSISSLYLGIALTFSSTIIIVKLLSDKREIDTLHGKIALGFLIVQDLVVILAMIVLASMAVGDANVTSKGMLSPMHSLYAVIGLLVTLAIFIRFFANPLTKMMARAPELLLIFSIAIATLLASLGKIIGLGMEVGGLLAGFALASTPFRETIATRLAPLRDFLLLFFFIGLGAQLHLSDLGANLTASLIFSLFVLIGNPLIVLIIMAKINYRAKTGFLAGLTVAQISEFSLIFIAMGVAMGHIAPSVMGLVTLVGIITIAFSTYMISYSHELYRYFEPALLWIESRMVKHPSHIDASQFDASSPSTVIFGLGRVGGYLLSQLKEQGISGLGVDLNPDEVHNARAQGLRAIYGDVTDAEFLNELSLEQTQWIVCTFPWLYTGVSFEDGRNALIQHLRQQGYRGKTIAVASSQADLQRLKKAGFDLVIQPHVQSAGQIYDIVTQIKE